MTNERYLVATYFCAVALGVLAASGCALLLRRSLAELTRVCMPTRSGRSLRAGVPIGLVLSCLLGLVSVPYINSCSGRPTYQEVVADRSYLTATSHAMVAAALSNLIYALLGFAMLIAVLLAAHARRTRRRT